MSGIFGTLNTANKGLMASQTALHTTGHNISNANTEGFSRQRVDMKADMAFHYAGVGQLGTGVKMEAVVRLVDDYVTRQIREENGTLNHFSSKAEVLQQLEIIFNEPSDTSLNFNIGEMFDAWNELSKNPELPTSKTIVVEKSKTMADTFNQIMRQMESLEGETEGLIEQNVKNLNANIEKLETLNKQIFNIAVKGQVPNDLLDQRDLLMKDMSSITNFKATEDKYGRVSISIGDEDVLVAGKEKHALEFEKNASGEIEFTVNDVPVDITTGEIRGRLDALDDLASRKDELATFGETLANEINLAHSSDLVGEDGDPIPDFFKYEDGSLGVNEYYINNNNEVVAGAQIDSPEGDGSRALAISNLRNEKLGFDGQLNTIGGFYNGIITSVGISKQHADNTVANQEILVGQLEMRRESTSGVSIDEEVTNLIKFNSAYAANARVISTLTQMLDVLMGMGA